MFTLGDQAYKSGSAAEYANYYDPSWGRFKAKTKPSLGNHEYQTTNATGYFGYFTAQLNPFGPTATDPTKGYYSYNTGSWHVLVLNSNCGIVSCAVGSQQHQWLAADLAAHPNRCAIAYFHHPLFSSGGAHGNNQQVQPLWQLLYDAGADVILNGHDHNYERFAPQRPDGVADGARGIRQFVVGTGGAKLRPFSTPLGNSEVRDFTAHGVMFLTLTPTGYNWRFTPIAGQSFTDSGSGACH